MGDRDGLERLWTPYRMAYVRSDTTADGCPFCRIPQGDDEESLVVARGEATYAVLNLHPYNPGHLMVLPYREASQSGVMALAEAAGVPVVGTPTGALVEQIAPGVNGLIADAVDGKALAYSIRRFLDDPGLYQRCILGISKHAEDRWSEAGERISRLLLETGVAAPPAPSYSAAQSGGEARAHLPQRRTAR